MREISYRNFSLDLHANKMRLNKPSLCHFELTFRCNFKCKYCYVAAGDKQELSRTELSTSQVKSLLDRVYEAGALWLCFTGGDPLVRKDFLEIYDYAKNKGFIISILTNASLLDKKLIAYFKKFPPFTFEITLNSVKKETFEDISGVEGSFDRVIQALKLLSENKIGFFLKAVLIKDNIAGLSDVKKFAQDLGVRFRVSPQILPRINKDKAPCLLRVKSEELVELNNKLEFGFKSPEFCFGDNFLQDSPLEHHSIFPCGGGLKDQICINPYGEMFFCLALRDISSNILNRSFESCFKEFAKVRQNGYKTQSRCRYCALRNVCASCPGKAYLETQDMEAPVEWCCEFTHLIYSNKKERQAA